MSNSELTLIYGGVSFSATLLNALVRGLTIIYDIGKRIGTSVIRYKTNNLCSIE